VRIQKLNCVLWDFHNPAQAHFSPAWPDSHCPSGKVNFVPTETSELRWSDSAEKPQGDVWDTNPLLVRLCRLQEPFSAIRRQNLRFVAVHLDRVNGLDGVLETIRLRFAGGGPLKERMEGAADVGF